MASDTIIVGYYRTDTVVSNGNSFINNVICKRKKGSEQVMRREMNRLHAPRCHIKSKITQL